MTRSDRIRVAQRKRGGPITHRSEDRNFALIVQRVLLPELRRGCQSETFIADDVLFFSVPI
uniref:Uncharacterized protein n=1 Tax=Physcomitrium patens TaxID=3218 RepID=A0A2K1KVT7_PHYPA|nr:hypothetical protein PHYPA_004888 [Physcomitrium patens]